MTRLFILLAIFVLFAAACDDAANAEASESVDEPAAEEVATASVVLDVDGMTCVNCAADIEEGFEEADGVVEGRIDFGERRAYVDYDADDFGVDDVIAVVEERGYEATVADK